MRISDWSSDVCSSDLDHQAFVAAPACADAEQLDAVDQRRRRLLPAGLESEAEESGRAGEVAAPDGMAGIGRQGRIEQAVDLRPLVQPLGQLQRVGLMALQPHRQGAQARSEEHTSELQSLMRISYAVFCLEQKNK